MKSPSAVALPMSKTTKGSVNQSHLQLLQSWSHFPQSATKAQINTSKTNISKHNTSKQESTRKPKRTLKQSNSMIVNMLSYSQSNASKPVLNQSTKNLLPVQGGNHQENNESHKNSIAPLPRMKTHSYSNPKTDAGKGLHVNR